MTLFRDSKGKYQPKPFTLRLKQAKDGALLATYTVDAAQFATVSAGQVFIPYLAYTFGCCSSTMLYHLDLSAQ